MGRITGIHPARPSMGRITGIHPARPVGLQALQASANHCNIASPAAVKISLGAVDQPIADNIHDAPVQELGIADAKVRIAPLATAVGLDPAGLQNVGHWEGLEARAWSPELVTTVIAMLHLTEDILHASKGAAPNVPDPEAA